MQVFYFQGFSARLYSHVPRNPHEPNTAAYVEFERGWNEAGQFKEETK